MKLAIFSVLTFLTAVMAATLPQKAVIVSYDPDTPESILDAAKEAIKSAGGMIVHEYKLIKGFAAQAPDKILETVQIMGNNYHAVIEEDQVVTIVGGDS